MINLDEAVSLLRAKREELLRELDAVDKALAALNGVTVAATAPTARVESPPAATEEAAPAVTLTKLKPARTLSDEHKHALKDGRRKARHAKNAAAGFARELSDPLGGLGPASSIDSRQPRLVKRTKR